MNYTEVFGSATIPPSANSYAAIALTADTTFYWPEQATGTNLMADIMEVTPTAAWAMTFPAANAASTGRDVLVRNLGAFAITIKDASGGTIGTVDAGVAKLLYIRDNSSAAGIWAIFTFGTGTSAADASALAGAGLRANGSQLEQTSPIGTSGANYTVVSADRAKTLSFTNSGVVTCSLSAAASMGDGFFVNVTNQGTGTVTIDPSSTELVDGASTKDLAPGESLILVCTGTGWVTIGFGRSTQFQFTKLVLDISSGTPFTLTSTQAQNKLLQFIGTVTAPVVVNVPAVVAVYYVQCSYTGAFTTTLKTAAGTGVVLSSSDRVIAYCDGVNVVLAQTASIPAANLTGGAAGQLVYQSGTSVTSFSTTGTAGQIPLSGGVGAPTWSDLGLITHSYSSKATPVDADEVPLSDSATSFGPKKVTWANIKATLGSLFAPIISPSFSGTLTHSGDIVLSGSGKRITGDFSNATVANRVMFIDAGNSNTVVEAICGSSGTVAAYALEEHSLSTTGNSSNASFNLVSGTDVRIASGIRGTGTYLPMTFYTGGSERMRIDTSGKITAATTVGPNAFVFTSTAAATEASFRFDNTQVSSGAAISTSNSGLNVQATWRVNVTGGWNAYVGQTAGSAATTGTPSLQLSSDGQVLQLAAAGLGYGTGAGGTVTQATSRTTAVTLNKPTGAITMFSAAGSATAATFTVTNSIVAAADTIVLSVKSGTNVYLTAVTAVAAGSFNITFWTTGGTASDSPVINFAVIKGATA